MKILIPSYYKYIGLLIVVSSIIYEFNRSVFDIDKGLFSINVGLFLILISKKERKNTDVGDVFLISFFFSWLVFLFLDNFILFELNTGMFITIVLFLSIAIRFFWLKNKVWFTR